MLNYYLGLKTEVEEFIDQEYEFKIEETKKVRARVKFKYKRKADGIWLEGEQFGRNERDFIANQPEFKGYDNTIKMYFPYRLFNKIAADKVMATSYNLQYA